MLEEGALADDGAARDEPSDADRPRTTRGPAGERIEQLLDELRASRGRWPASGPRSWSGWSPSCTAPAWSGCSRSSRRRACRRPLWTSSPPTSWSPACWSCTACTRRPGRRGSSGRSSRCGRSCARTAATSSCSTSTRHGRGHLRLLGHCDGCPSRPSRCSIAVERAIEEAAPEIVRSSTSSRADRARRTRRPSAALDPGRVAITGPDRRMTRPRRAARRCCGGSGRRRRRRPAGRAVRAVRRADRRRARRTSSTSRSRSAAVHLPAVLPAVHTRTRRRALPGGARPLPRRSTDCRCRAVGRPADPGQRRVLLRQLRARPRRGVYPSPAGATESLLPLDTWDEVVAADPELATLAPDVEAFLVRVDGQPRSRCYLVPIDACYELVGQLRRLWRGFDGGQEAHERAGRVLRPGRRARRCRRDRARASTSSTSAPSRTPRCRR